MECVLLSPEDPRKLPVTHCNFLEGREQILKHLESPQHCDLCAQRIPTDEEEFLSLKIENHVFKIICDGKTRMTKKNKFIHSDLLITYTNANGII